MISKLAVAFLCGVILFGITVLVKNRKRIAARRKTTRLRMAKVVADAAVSAAPQAASFSGVGAVYKISEKPGAAPSAPVSPGDDDRAGDEHVVEVYEQAAGADDCAADEQVAGEQAAEDQSEDQAADVQSDDSRDEEGAVDGGQSDDADPPMLYARAIDESQDEDPGDETRETHAVSMADIMNACDDDDDDGALGGRQDSDPDPAETYKPITSGIAAEADAPFPLPKRRLPETVRLKERKVLLADDKKVHRDLITVFFEGSGIKFDCAENGREAFDKFRENPRGYSLILMDVQMPVMDGCEAASRIRALGVDWAKQIPIIAMTSGDQKDDIDRSFDSGMDDHITKPLDMEALQEKVFEFLPVNVE